MDSTKLLHFHLESSTFFSSLAFSLPSYFSSLHNRIHFYYVFLSSLYRSCSSTRTYVNHRDWVLWLPNVWVQEKYNLDLLWFQLEIWLFPEHWKWSTRLLSILKPFWSFANISWHWSFSSVLMELFWALFHDVNWLFLSHFCGIVDYSFMRHPIFLIRARWFSVLSA